MATTTVNATPSVDYADRRADAQRRAEIRTLGDKPNRTPADDKRLLTLLAQAYVVSPP